MTTLLSRYGSNLKVDWQVCLSKLDLTFAALGARYCKFASVIVITLLQSSSQSIARGFLSNIIAIKTWECLSNIVTIQLAKFFSNVIAKKPWKWLSDIGAIELWECLSDLVTIKLAFVWATLSQSNFEAFQASFVAIKLYDHSNNLVAIKLWKFSIYACTLSQQEITHIW